MRASIAVIAAVAGIASAVPHYGYGAYEYVEDYIGRAVKNSC
jgi:hypothetical protein